MQPLDTTVRERSGARAESSVFSAEAVEATANISETPMPAIQEKQEAAPAEADRKSVV